MATHEDGNADARRRHVGTIAKPPPIVSYRGRFVFAVTTLMRASTSNTIIIAKSVAERKGFSAAIWRGILEKNILCSPHTLQGIPTTIA